MLRATLLALALSPALALAQTYTVVRVTSLADSGPGTLLACAALTVSRLCVFEVYGRIRLKSTLFVDAPNLVVAGQTAPGRVMLTNDTLTRAGSGI